MAICTKLEIFIPFSASYGQIILAIFNRALKFETGDHFVRSRCLPVEFMNHGFISVATHHHLLFLELLGNLELKQFNLILMQSHNWRPTKHQTTSTVRLKTLHGKIKN